MVCVLFLGGKEGWKRETGGVLGVGKERGGMGREGEGWNTLDGIGWSGGWGKRDGTH